MKINNIHRLLTRNLTASLLSILIGIFSGIAINLFTNPIQNRYYNYSIILIVLIIFLFLRLIIWYEAFHNNYNNEMLNNENIKQQNLAKINRGEQDLASVKSEEEMWECSINNVPKYRYYFMLISAGILSISSILLVYYGNIKVPASNNNDTKSTSVCLFQMSDSLCQMNIKVQKLSDSIRVLNKKNNVSKYSGR